MRTIRSLIILVALAAAATSACTPPPTIVTQPGKTAYQADQVVLRLTEISNVVKADTGSQPGNIRPRDAFTIIEWISGDSGATPPTTGIVQVVQTTAGQGWKVAAAQGWNARIRPLFLSYPKLAPYVDIVDALLGVL